MKYPRVPAHEFVILASKLFPDKLALNFQGTESTFWELRRKVMARSSHVSPAGHAAP